MTGHSFGGAIVLSALKSFVLERVAAAAVRKNPGDDCVETRPFGHGVVLLNPAIEANKVFSCRERRLDMFCSQSGLGSWTSSVRTPMTRRMMRSAWPSGLRSPSLRVKPRWSDKSMTGEVQIQESDLDTIAVGNFIPFNTGQLNRLGYQSCIGPGAVCFEVADRINNSHKK